MNIPEKLLTMDVMSEQNYIYTLNKIIDCLHDIEARLPKQEAPKRWRAEVDTRYWAIDGDGETVNSVEENDRVDDWRYNTGNYHRTEAEAQKYREQLLTNGARV